MKRLILLFLVLLWAPQAALASETSEASVGGSHALPHGGCPVVCEGHEACIENRCVETCRPTCRLGTYCTASRECLSYPEPEEPLLTEADRQRLSGAESRDSELLIFADLGGIIGFGAKLGVEFGKQHSFLTRVTLLNTGIMTHAFFAGSINWGLGVSAGYRFYEADWGNLRGFYYGGGLDYSLLATTERGVSSRSDIHHSLAPFGEFGYRWVFGDIAVGFGPTLALRYPIGNGFTKSGAFICGGDPTCEDLGTSRFEGTLHVEIGWFQ